MPKVQVNQITSQTGSVLTIGQSGDTVTLATGATSSGFGRSGAVNWSSTVLTSGFTAVSGNGYFCNTTSAGFTVTLPASAAAGDILSFKDYAKTWNTNNLTLNLNGLKAEGSTTNPVQTTQGQSITLVYVDSTKGWVITDSAQTSELNQTAFVAATGGTVITCGNYKTHVFTSSGCFVVSSAGNCAGSNSVEYLVVAGGGGSGKCYGGGGGAGGFRQIFPSPASAGLPVAATTYPITVGAGGGTAASPARPGTKGGDSVFSTITSTGGGFGATWSPSPGYPGGGGGPGGSGGGGGGSGINQPPGPGGSGNTPPVSPSQGNPGGQGAGTGQYGSAGGGGASAAGAQGSSAGGCNGGAGSSILSTIFGPTAPSYGTSGPSPTGRYFAGGGSGYGNPAGGGGVGGGGNVQTSGTTNTGGGGGAEAGSGASGIVVIRYKYQ